MCTLLATLFIHGMWFGHDWVAHFQRMNSLNEELAHQQFPPLFDYWSPGQFGYSWQLFYPPLTSLLFLGARVLTFFSADMIMQMKAVFLLIFAIAFACSFYAAKREHDSNAAGYLCAILFTTSGYFLTNIYIRFALGECLAMALMPLFIRGCSSLIGDRKDIWLLPFSAVMIFLSNIPSSVTLFLFVVLFALANPRLIAVKKNILFFIVSLLVILSVSAFYWAPLFYHIRFSDIFATSGKQLVYADLLKFSSGLQETLLSLPSTYGASNPGMFLSVGVIQLLLAVAYLKFGVSLSGKKIIIIALLMILATTHFLPWDIIPDSVPIIKLLQFPWRLLSCATAAIALTVSGMLAHFMVKNRALAVLLTCLCIAAMYPPLAAALQQRQDAIDADALYKDYMINNLYDDYLNDKNVRSENYFYLKYNDFDHFANPQASIITTHYSGGYPVLHIRSDGPQTVTLPYIMYAGYTLLVDGEQQDIISMDSGLAGVRLTGGVHQVSLIYRRNIIIIPSLFSLISLALTLYSYARCRRAHSL